MLFSFKERSNVLSLEVGSSFIVDTAVNTPNGNWFAFQVSGPNLDSAKSGKYRPRKRRLRKRRKKKIARAEKSRRADSLETVVSETVLIEMGSKVEEGYWTSSPPLESPPSTRLEAFADRRKIGQTDWKIAAREPIQ